MKRERIEKEKESSSSQSQVAEMRGLLNRAEDRLAELAGEQQQKCAYYELRMEREFQRQFFVHVYQGGSMEAPFRFKITETDGRI